MHVDNNWNDTANYTVLQPMRIDNRTADNKRKRCQMPSRIEINNHLRFLCNKLINNRTPLLIQTLIQHEYNHKINQLKEVEEQYQTDSDEEYYECYAGFVYSRAISSRRKKYKAIKC